MENKKQKILDFIKKQEHTVVSTINPKENKPEGAVVAFSETDNLEIIFGTSNNARKFKNIKSNSRVALVIGWDNKINITIQYEGIAKEIKEDEISYYLKRHINKHPGSIKYAHLKDEKYFKIITIWIRYSDYSVDPKEVFEVIFNHQNL